MSIRSKILSMMSITILMITVMVSILIYKNQKKTLLDGVDEKLVTAANFAKAVLPENYHDAIVDAYSISKDDFDQIVDRNNKLCLELNLQYIWSVMIIDNQIVMPVYILLKIANSYRVIQRKSNQKHARCGRRW